MDHPDFLWLHGIDGDSSVDASPSVYLNILTRYDAPYPHRAIAGLTRSVEQSRPLHRAHLAVARNEAERSTVRAFAAACELVHDTAQDTLALTGDVQAALRAALAVCASTAIPEGFGAELAHEMLQAATTAPRAADRSP